MDLTSPAQLAMQYYFENTERLKKYRGNSRMTIAEKLNNDLKTAAKYNTECKKVAESLQSLADLKKLREFAQNKIEWLRFTNSLCETVHVDRSTQINN